MLCASIKLTVAPGGPIGIGNACRISSMLAPYVKTREVYIARQVSMDLCYVFLNWVKVIMIIGKTLITLIYLFEKEIDYSDFFNKTLKIHVAIFTSGVTSTCFPGKPGGPCSPLLPSLPCERTKHSKLQHPFSQKDFLFIL